jgi:hypothetical protein
LVSEDTLVGRVGAAAGRVKAENSSMNTYAYVMINSLALTVRISSWSLDFAACSVGCGRLRRATLWYTSFTSSYGILLRGSGCGCSCNIVVGHVETKQGGKMLGGDVCYGEERRVGSCGRWRARQWVILRLEVMLAWLER